MPVPEQAGADDVEVLKASLDDDDDEDVLPVSDESREASIWLALLAADAAIRGSMTNLQKVGVQDFSARVLLAPVFLARIMPMSWIFWVPQRRRKQVERNLTL
jgi:hypothetical protein